MKLNIGENGGIGNITQLTSCKPQQNGLTGIQTYT